MREVRERGDDHAQETTRQIITLILARRPQASQWEWLKELGKTKAQMLMVRGIIDAINLKMEAQTILVALARTVEVLDGMMVDVEA